MNIGIVRITEVDAVWPSIADRFQEASDICGDDFSPGELWQRCRSGQSFLIAASDQNGISAALVAQPERWVDGTVLRILSLGGGNFETWIRDGMQFLKEFQEVCKATRIVFDGRDGWTRKAIPGAKIRKLRSTYVMETE
jgi:hypothetical protein